MDGKESTSLNIWKNFPDFSISFTKKILMAKRTLQSYQKRWEIKWK